MARKHRPKKKLQPEDFFIQLYKIFFDEPAWLALPMGARCLYLDVKRLYNGRNNGELFLSVREAARRLGCSPSSAHGWFQELTDKGFIRPATPGTLGVNGRGLATCWILTEIGYRGGRPTKDFANWQPGQKKTDSRAQN